MKIYFAHPMSEYGGTDRQKNAIRLLSERGYTVENPDQPHHQDGYKAEGFKYFLDRVRECDALAFMRFRSGGIGAGVSKELGAALSASLQIYEFDADGRLLIWPVLTVGETCAALAVERPK